MEASDPFEQRRDPLADADAHGRDGPLLATLLQRAHRGQGEPSPGGAERVAQRDGAARGQPA